MTKKERATLVINTLKEIYPEIPIPLDHKDAYTLLIAVLLSAQCTDVRVNKITPLLFAKADNKAVEVRKAKMIARLKEEDVSAKVAVAVLNATPKRRGFQRSFR